MSISSDKEKYIVPYGWPNKYRSGEDKIDHIRFKKSIAEIMAYREDRERYIRKLKEVLDRAHEEAQCEYECYYDAEIVEESETEGG